MIIEKEKNVDVDYEQFCRGMHEATALTRSNEIDDVSSGLCRLTDEIFYPFLAFIIQF